MKSWFYIFNWKTYLTFTQMMSLMHKHGADLIDLSIEKEQMILICPSFELISMMQMLFKQDVIQIGAQDCSAYEPGAYTGQVSAASLASMNVDFVIVGHSEHANSDDPFLVQRKIDQLLQNDITPIVCLGEVQEKDEDETMADISSQMKVLFAPFNKYPNPPIVVAYEPRWAINSGKTPSIENITSVITAIKAYLAQKFPERDIKILYGGSVTAKNIASLKKIDELDGFLIGKASTDFKSIKKIVS